MIRDAIFSGVGIYLGWLWLSWGHVATAILLFVAAGYMFGLTTTSRAWRRDLAPLLPNQPRTDASRES